jgi:putative endonuclease
MPKVFTSPTQKIGEIGESVASRFLVKQGYSILERNYTKKWGEIDMIAQKDKVLYFVEVKSVSRETLPTKDKEDKVDDYRAEDNMHPWKAKRMARTIQTYLLSKKVSEDTDWEAMLLVVYLNMKSRKASVKVINDLIL